MSEKKKTIVVHWDNFHADDVFSAATLQSLFEDAEIVRTRDPKIISPADFVADVGGIYDAEKNRFDHHQKEGAGMRDNGIPYASFGLVWKKFGEELCGSKEVADAVDKILVAPVDADDNGVNLAVRKSEAAFPYCLSDVIYSFNSTWREGCGHTENLFEDAVSVAKRVLKRAIENAKALIEGEKIVREIYEQSSDKRIVVFDLRYPWERILAKFPEPLFAIYPKIGGEWHTKCVRDDFESFKNRKNFPDSWAGLRNEDFAKVSGVPDAIFCHRNKFLAVAKSKEGAIALAQKALCS